MMNFLGSKIKKLRIFNELTQEDVAVRLFLSLKAYQNIEHGLTKLDLERIKELANIFEIPADDLINGSELKIKFEDPKSLEKAHARILRGSHFPADIEVYRQLLIEKESEIAFLRELVNKLSAGNH